MIVRFSMMTGKQIVFSCSSSLFLPKKLKKICDAMKVQDHSKWAVEVHTFACITYNFHNCIFCLLVGIFTNFCIFKEDILSRLLHVFYFSIFQV